MDSLSIMFRPRFIRGILNPSLFRYTKHFYSIPQVNSSKILKNLQKLRRKPDPFIQKQSTDHLLSLLSKDELVNASNLHEDYLSNVTAVTVGDSIDFDTLIHKLNSLQFKFEVVIPSEVINISISAHTSLMILSNGTLIGWNLLENTLMRDYFPLISPSINELYQIESDEMYFLDITDPINPYDTNNGNSYLQGEIFIIQSNSETKKLLDKAAFAIGLSRSTRLAILENSLENYLQLTKTNSQYLTQGKLITNEKQVLKLIGKILLLRGKLNLYSELIEIPDLYWEEPSLEKIYYSISKVLDINSRISILNRKLDYSYDEQHAFLSVLNEKKSTRLEWIIIILIMVEVGFETSHFIEKRQDKNEKLIEDAKSNKD